MRGWSAERVAAAAGARLVRAGAPRPAARARAVIDSRHAGPGDLFVGLPGERDRRRALRRRRAGAGAWGVLVGERAPATPTPAGGGAVLVAADPLAALQRLATAWRRELGAQVDRRHRLDRQDLHQGPARRDDRPAAARGRHAAEPQHRDRAAADRPERARRDRGARLGDGDARRRADRRAGRDRRARRRRDRQRRARAPGAARGRSRRSPRPRPS